MKTRRQSATLILFACLLLGLSCPAQDVENSMPYDPSNTKSRIPIDFDSYYFLGGHRIYSAVFGYRYGIPNNKHMMGITVPVIHAIFNDDFAGFENTTGIGDLRFLYMGVPYTAKKNSLNLKRVAAYLEVTAPTGNQILGRGVGSWLYRPGIIFTYQPDISWYIFPELRFQFSTTEVNTHGGSSGLPDLEDAQADEVLQNLSIQIPTTYVLNEWDGWIGMLVDYSYTYIERTYYIFLRVEVGKMLTPKTAASLQLTRFVAGQPRLMTIFQARFNFFL